MAYVGDTGQGAAVTLDTTGAVGCARSIQLPEWVMEKVDATCLETTDFMRYVPADLSDPGEAVIEAIFAATNDVPKPGTIEDITITFPIGDPTNTVAATLTGSGFISTTAMPNMATSELMVLTITFAFDGDTGPAYSVEATS